MTYVDELQTASRSCICFDLFSFSNPTRLMTKIEHLHCKVKYNFSVSTGRRIFRAWVLNYKTFLLLPLTWMWWNGGFVLDFWIKNLFNCQWSEYLLKCFCSELWYSSFFLVCFSMPQQFKSQDISPQMATVMTISYRRERLGSE